MDRKILTPLGIISLLFASCHSDPDHSKKSGHVIYDQEASPLQKQPESSESDAKANSQPEPQSAEPPSEDASAPQSVTGVLLSDILCEQKSPKIAHCWFVDQKGQPIPDEKVQSVAGAPGTSPYQFERIAPLSPDLPFFLKVTRTDDADLGEGFFSSPLSLKVIFEDQGEEQFAEPPKAGQAPGQSVSPDGLTFTQTTELIQATDAATFELIMMTEGALPWMAKSQIMVADMASICGLQIEIVNFSGLGSGWGKIYLISPKNEVFVLGNFTNSGIFPLMGVTFRRDSSLPHFSLDAINAGYREFDPESNLPLLLDPGEANGGWQLLFATDEPPVNQGVVTWRLTFVD